MWLLLKLEFPFPGGRCDCISSPRCGPSWVWETKLANRLSDIHTHIGKWELAQASPQALGRRGLCQRKICCWSPPKSCIEEVIPPALPRDQWVTWVTLRTKGSKKVSEARREGRGLSQHTGGWGRKDPYSLLSNNTKRKGEEQKREKGSGLWRDGLGAKEHLLLLKMTQTTMWGSSQPPLCPALRNPMRSSASTDTQKAHVYTDEQRYIH